MPVQWENKEIAMANIFTLVGKPLLFFFVLIEVHRLDFVEKPKGKKNDSSFHNVALPTLKLTYLQLTKEMFFTVFLLLHFFAKLPDSKKDFTNWSGQEYLLCLDSAV